VNELRGPGLGILIITHYERILRYINPDFVHIMVDGKIVKSGGPDLAGASRRARLRLDHQGRGTGVPFPQRVRR
jgi:Fe-S cluster assembly ATPase SufC